MKSTKIKVETYINRGIPAESEVTIFLGHRDWCKIQASKAWKELERYVDQLEREHSLQGNLQ